MLLAFLWMRTFFFGLQTFLIFVDLSSFFDTVRNFAAWQELVNVAGVPWHCVRALREISKLLRGIVVTMTDVSSERDLPDNVVQGGVFSTLGGKSVLRLVYKEFFSVHEGVTSGFQLLKKVPYFLFADDGVLPAEKFDDIKEVAGTFWRSAKKWGLAPNDKTFVKQFGANKRETRDVICEGGN